MLFVLLRNRVLSSIKVIISSNPKSSVTRLVPWPFVSTVLYTLALPY